MRRRRKPQNAAAPWWASETECDPVSLEPISELPYAPFALLTEGEGSIAILFDPACLAEYLVTTAVFSHPISRRPLTRVDCVALDEHMARAGLPPLKVAQMHDTVTMVVAQAGTTSRRGGDRGGSLYDELAAAQAAAVPDNIMAVREASVVLNNLFDFTGDAVAAPRGGSSGGGGGAGSDYHPSAFAEPIDVNDAEAFPAMAAPQHTVARAGPGPSGGQGRRVRLGGRYAPQTFDTEADFPSLGGGGKVTRRPVARSGRSAQWAANLARARDRYSQIQVRNGGKSRHASVRGEARLAVHPSLVPRGQSGGGGGRKQKQKQKQRSGGPVPAPRPMPRAARVGSSGATTTKTKAAVSSMASALKARPPQPAPRSGSGGPSAAWLLRGGGASSNRSAAKQQQQQQQRRYVPPSASSTEAYPVLQAPVARAPVSSSSWGSGKSSSGSAAGTSVGGKAGKKKKTKGVQTFYLAASKPKPKAKKIVVAAQKKTKNGKGGGASWGKVKTTKKGKGAGKAAGKSKSVGQKTGKKKGLDTGWPT